MHPTASVTVYALEASRLAAFYAAVAGLLVVEESASFTVLAGSSFELSVVQVAPEIAADIHVASPPRPRAETPIKLSLLVDSIEACRVVVTRHGGSLQPASASWSWRGQSHLDGTDPEGNVFQLRESRT